MYTLIHKYVQGDGAEEEEEGEDLDETMDVKYNEGTTCIDLSIYSYIFM